MKKRKKDKHSSTKTTQKAKRLNNTNPIKLGDSMGTQEAKLACRNAKAEQQGNHTSLLMSYILANDNIVENKYK
jgi:hypothetical protein